MKTCIALTLASLALTTAEASFAHSGEITSIVQQSTKKIRGCVLDSSGQPLIGVTVG